MKPFESYAKVEVLWSAGDKPADWTKATVTGIVHPNMDGIGDTGNTVKIDGTQHIIVVTEPGMIRPLE